MTDPRLNPGAELDALQRLYRQEIEHVMSEIDSLLARFHKRVDEAVTAHARDSLRILKSCYQENALSIPALDVLLQHLITLAGMFKHKLN